MKVEAEVKVEVEAEEKVEAGEKVEAALPRVKTTLSRAASHVNLTVGRFIFLEESSWTMARCRGNGR